MIERVDLVAEGDVSDTRLRDSYRDIKQSLRLATLDVVFEAYGAWPRFLDFTWRRIRPSIATEPFYANAQRVGMLVRDATSGWPVASVARELASRGVAEAELRRLRDIVDCFESVQPRVAVIAKAVALAISGVDVGSGALIGPRSGDERERFVPDFRGMAVAVVDDGAAPPRVRQIFDGLRAVTGSNVIDTPVRAMAGNPDWLELWWRDARALLTDVRSASLLSDVDDALADAARRLPYRLDLSSRSLLSFGMGEAEIDRIASVSQLMAKVAARSLVHVAIARRGLM